MSNKKHIITKHLSLILVIAQFYLPLTGMQEQVYLKTITLTPDQTHHLPHRNTRGLPLDQFPYITTCITPNEEFVITSYGGAVYKNNIGSSSNHKESDSKLFEHTSAKLNTLLTTDKTKNGTLLIVSGGNYCNKKEEPVSEMISFSYTSDPSYTVKKFDWPLQALKLSHKGTLLIAASPSSIHLFNLEKDTHKTTEIDRSTSRYLNESEQKKIIDVDISYDPNTTIFNALIAVLMTGNSIQLMKINEEQTDLTFSSKINVLDSLSQLTLPTPRTILCATEKSKAKTIGIKTEPINTKAKTIDMFDFINGEDKIKPTFFSHSVTYEEVALDQFSQTTAHWTMNQDRTDAERAIILINRITNPKNSTHPDPEEDKTAPIREHFRLSALFGNKKTYPIITATAKSGIRKSHFLTVSVRNLTVSAEASTGQRFVWKLPAIKSPHTMELSHLSNNEEEFVISDTPHRRSSSNDYYSSNITTTTTTASASSPLLGQKKRKTSIPSSPIRTLKSHNQSRSNSSSPRTSPTDTPKDSPKKSLSTELKQTLRRSDDGK